MVALCRRRSEAVHMVGGEDAPPGVLVISLSVSTDGSALKDDDGRDVYELELTSASGASLLLHGFTSLSSVRIKSQRVCLCVCGGEGG
jgi:hypothetical protein